MVTIGDTGISFSTKTNEGECFACKVKFTTNIEGQEVVTTFFDADQDGFLDKIFVYLVQSEEGEFIPVTSKDQRVFSKSLQAIKIWQKNNVNI